MANTKIDTVKTFIGANVVDDSAIQVYLDLAEHELLVWTFGSETTLTAVPSWLEPVQIMAVVEGINQRGGEGETQETVDGVTHAFKYDSMIGYIHSNAPSYVKVL